MRDKTRFRHAVGEMRGRRFVAAHKTTLGAAFADPARGYCSFRAAVAVIVASDAATASETTQQDSREAMTNRKWRFAGRGA
ncbi:hypothetical protein [Paraburkholderia sp. WC7.3d]|uniref:hypothetical protein n=1 Tax=Paraburkholderia sp. WC7.3d TaxID=2991069 RepID=UPI003D221A61